MIQKHYSTKEYALYDLGQLTDAIAYYDRALAIDGNNTNALNNKGVALSDLGQLQGGNNIL